MRKLQIMVALFLGVVLALGACAPKLAAPPEAPSPGAAPPAVSEWDRIVAAAEKEGTVTVYLGRGADIRTGMQEGFKKAYPGIKVEVVGGTGPDLEARIGMEQRAKVYVTDLLWTGSTDVYRLVNAGAVQEVTIDLPAAQEKDVWRYHPYGTARERRAFLLERDPTPTLIINTEKVKEGEITWFADLLNPKWKGRMVMEDPRLQGGGTGGMYFAMELGEDFWKKMAQQDISMRIRGAVVDAVVHGEDDVGIWASSTRSVTAIQAGAPIKFLHLKDGTKASGKLAAVINNAPHPNAALVLLNWLMTKEGQEAFNRAGSKMTIRTDLVEDWIEIKELRFEAAYSIYPPKDETDPEYAVKGTEFAVKIFGKL